MPIQQPVRVLSEHAEGPIDTVINPVVSKLEDATHTADETQQHEGQVSGSRFAVALWAGFVATLLVFKMQVIGLVSQSGGAFFAFSPYFIVAWVNGAFAGAAVVACRSFSARRRVSEADGATPADETQPEHKACSCLCVTTLWVGFVVTLAFFVMLCWRLVNHFYNMPPVIDSPRSGWSPEQWLMEIVEILWGVVLCLWVNGALAGALAAISCRKC